MSVSSSAAPAASPTTRRDLRAITRDGVYFSSMVGLGESYVPAFALALGLGDVTAGLLSILPMVGGACLQLVTPFAVRTIGSYRQWVVLCAGLQGLSFVPLVTAALLGRVGVAWVALPAVAYWAFGMSTGPAWNAWVTSLVPREIRETFFAHRTRAAHTALLVALVFGGLALELGRVRGFELPVFAVLFAGAAVTRLVSAGYLAAQSERPGLITGHRTLGPAATLRRLGEAGSLRVLRYLLVMQVATNIAAPYFTPYMLSHLALSYGEFMALTATSFVARVAVLPALGRIARDHGARRLLWMGGLAIVPLPVLWLVSDSLVYLLAVQALAGCAWAAVELATTLSFFDGISDADRASVLSVFNLANALAMVAGALIGAQLLARAGASADLYAWLFAASSSGRLLAAFLLGRVRSPGPGAPGLRLRTLAVRPSGVAVQRPILASMEEPASGSEAPPGPGEGALR